MLTQCIDNERVLVNTCMSKLVNSACMSSESADDLKRLHMHKNSTYALNSSGRPVYQWNDFLVFLTVQRLDKITRKDWEIS